LSPQLSDVHDVFHVSHLKKCLHVPEEQLSMEELEAKDLFYQEYHVKILETSERLLETRRSRCARCSGVTIPRKKLHGKGKRN
jgi:hypothetical protein